MFFGLNLIGGILNKSRNTNIAPGGYSFPMLGPYLFKLSFNILSTSATILGIPKSSCPVRYNDAEMHAPVSLLLLGISSMFPRTYTYEPPFLDIQAGKQESHLIHMHNYVEQMKIHVTLWRGTCVLLPHQTHNKKTCYFVSRGRYLIWITLIIFDPQFQLVSY